MTEYSPPQTTRRRRNQTIWGRLKLHPSAMIGAALFSVIALSVLIGPGLWDISPLSVDITIKNQGPSLAHPMGTDQLGRDLFAAILYGGRVSLLVGVVAMGLSLVLGTVVGVLAGTLRWLDAPLMRLTDLFLALPLLPLLLVVIMLWRDSLRTAFGPETGVFILIVFVIGITSWMQTARIVRGDVLALREREFIMAATALGTQPASMIRRHILPNIASPILVSATMGIGQAIITESALSFLGLGFPSDFPTWGRLLFDGTNYMSLSPTRVIWPGLAITLTVLSVNYIGDGLRDALDPHRLRR